MLKLYIPAMTCSHCAHKVESTIKAADAGATVEIDLPNRTILLRSLAEEAGVVSALTSAGFPAHKVA